MTGIKNVASSDAKNNEKELASQNTPIRKLTRYSISRKTIPMIAAIRCDLVCIKFTPFIFILVL